MFPVEALEDFAPASRLGDMGRADAETPSCGVGPPRRPAPLDRACPEGRRRPLDPTMAAGEGR